VHTEARDVSKGGVGMRHSTVGSLWENVGSPTPDMPKSPVFQRNTEWPVTALQVHCTIKTSGQSNLT